MVQGNTHPGFVNQYTNPEKEQFNLQDVVRFIQSLDKSEVRTMEFKFEQALKKVESLKIQYFSSRDFM